MVDNYRQLFLVPGGINDAVDREIRLIQLGELDRPNPVVPNYCQKVSSIEYERQKCETPNEHLIELLGAIVRDENMSSKLKKKKLKLVHMPHPHATPK